MLKLTIKGHEEFNNDTMEFIYTKDTTIVLEHSLVSISKWESKFHKPFISKDKKTSEEILYYIQCMTITQNVDPNIYNLLTVENIDEVNKYIDDSMTATWFNDSKQPSGRTNSETITSELIYYWMIALQIPFECQKWHLNRLLVLIRICNIKNQPHKTMSQKEILRSNASLNAQRRKALGTSG